MGGCGSGGACGLSFVIASIFSLTYKIRSSAKIKKGKIVLHGWSDKRKVLPRRMGKWMDWGNIVDC